MHTLVFYVCLTCSLLTCVYLWSVLFNVHFMFTSYTALWNMVYEWAHLMCCVIGFNGYYVFNHVLHLTFGMVVIFPLWSSHTLWPLVHFWQPSCGARHDMTWHALVAFVAHHIYPQLHTPFLDFTNDTLFVPAHVTFMLDMFAHPPSLLLAPHPFTHTCFLTTTLCLCLLRASVFAVIRFVL